MKREIASIDNEYVVVRERHVKQQLRNTKRERNV